MFRISCLVVLTFLAVSLVAQESYDPSLVYVRATAFDKEGRVVTQLAQDEFKVLEDNVPQKISYFSNHGSLSVVSLIDADDKTREEVSKMVRKTFPADVRTAAFLTSGPEELIETDSNKLPLNEAVHAALNVLLQRQGDKRALIVFTTKNEPGLESFTKVKNLLKDRDVRLYVINSYPSNPSVANPSLDRSGAAILRTLAESTGGSAFYNSSIPAHARTYRTIALELRNQYVLGYRPSNQAADGKWRKIKVDAEHVLQGKKLAFTIRTKSGYYAPTKSSR